MGIHLSEITPLGGLSREETRDAARLLWNEAGKTPGGLSPDGINRILEPFSLSFETIKAAGWLDDEAVSRRRGVAAGLVTLSDLTGQVANAPTQPRMTFAEAGAQAKTVIQRLESAPAEIDGIRINALYLFGSAVRDNNSRPSIGDLDISADFGFDARYKDMDAKTRSDIAKAKWQELISLGDERLQLSDAQSLPEMGGNSKGFHAVKLWQNPVPGVGSYTPDQQVRVDAIAAESLATQKRAKAMVGAITPLPALSPAETAETLKGWYLLRGYNADFDPLSTVMDLDKDAAIAKMKEIHPTRGIGEADADGNRDQAKYYQLRAEADQWVRDNSGAVKDRRNPVFFALTNDPETVRRHMNSPGNNVLMMPLAEADLSKFSITFDDSMGNYRTTVLDTKNTGINGEFLPDVSEVHGKVLNAQQFAAAIKTYGVTDATGGLRNIEAQYWGAEQLKAQIIPYDPALPKPPRPHGDAPSAKTVKLYHGTSEANLGSILENGFEQRYTSARDRVRGMIGEVNGTGTASDADVDKVLGQRRISGRVQEVGNLLYTSSDRTTAEKYGYQFKAVGGEINRDIQLALGGTYAPKDIHGDARPVLLTLEVPEQAVVPVNGQLRTDTYETLVRSGGAKVATVTFAAKDSSGNWSFDGQPALTPDEAAKQLHPQFKAKAATAPKDPEQQRILKSINDFALGSDATLKQDTAAFMYVAETKMTDADGRSVTVRIPDSRFAPQAQERFGQYGFKGVTAEYKMPHGLTPAELSAYVTVLEAKAQKGSITQAEKITEMRGLMGAMEEANPGLKAIAFDRADPAKVSAVLKGAINAYSPENLQHHVSAARIDGYADLQKSATAGAGIKADIDLAPEALKEIRAEVDRKVAALETQTKPAAPRDAFNEAAPKANKPAGPESSSVTKVAETPQPPKAAAGVNKTSTPDTNKPSAFGGTQAKLGHATGAAQVAVDIASGNYGQAATGAAVQLALDPKTYTTAAQLTAAVKPVAKALGFVVKRLPIIGGAWTLGCMLLESGSYALDGKFGQATAAFGAGTAEAAGNIFGFGLGDAARETVRGLVIATAGEEYAVSKSGLRQLGEGAVAVGSKFMSGAVVEKKTTAEAVTTASIHRPKTPTI